MFSLVLDSPGRGAEHSGALRTSAICFSLLLEFPKAHWGQTKPCGDGPSDKPPFTANIG